VPAEHLAAAPHDGRGLPARRADEVERHVRPRGRRCGDDDDGRDAHAMMVRRMSRSVKWAAVVAAFLLVLAIPVYVLVRSHLEGARLARLLHEEMVERKGCPVPEPFVEPSAVTLGCWDGALPSGRRLILILGTEPGSRAQVASYIGIWLPPGPDLTD